MSAARARPGATAGGAAGSAAGFAAGFTLIEVLVAMTIIAVGVAALVLSAAASSRRADDLREREFARWVASNELAVREVLPAWPDPGTTNTEVEMGSRRWYVRTRTRAVADPQLRRIDIEVRASRDVESYLYSVTGFLGDPALRGTGESPGAIVGDQPGLGNGGTGSGGGGAELGGGAGTGLDGDGAGSGGSGSGAFQ